MAYESRKVVWNTGAERAYEKDFSESLRDRVDLALLEIAAGENPSDPRLVLAPHGHPFDGDVWKLKIKDRAGTYRVVYFRAYREAIYVVNAYQKRSHRGSDEPQEKIVSTRIRLKWAEAEHEAYLRAEAVKTKGEDVQ